MSLWPGRRRARLRCEQLEVRDAPSVSVWEQQSFDNLAAGAIPASWQQWSSNGAPSFGASSLQHFLGSNSLASSGLSSQTGRAWDTSLMPADFAVAGQFYLNAIQPLQMFIRGRNLAGPQPTYYAVSVTRGMQLQLLRVVNGAATVLASLQTSAYLTDTWVRVTIRPHGSNLAVEVFRADTNQYLTPSGTWQGSAASCINVTDSAISGPGYVGINRPAAYAASVFLDEFQVLAPPTTENFDAAPPATLPPGWAQWASTSAAAFRTSNSAAQSAPQALVSSSTLSTARARAWLDTDLAQNVQVSASVFLDTLVPLRVFARGTTLATTTPSYYAVSITRGLQLTLVRVVNGVAVELGKVQSGDYISNQWVRVTLVAAAGRVQALVSRADTGQYLDASGAWQTGIARALDVADNVITGVGRAGVERVGPYAGAVAVDNFEAAAAGNVAAAPTVTISAPAGGSTVSGAVTIAAAVAAPGPIQHVEFSVDGVLRFVTTQAPYQWSLDSTALANGTHTIRVSAIDMVGNAGAAQVSIEVANDGVPAPTIPRHYRHIRLANLAYSGTPFTLFEDNLLRSSIDLVIPNANYLAHIDSVAPNTPQLVYSNASNIYEKLLTDWLAYANAHGLDRELAFYHAAKPIAWTGASASSLPVNWFWSVQRGPDLDHLTNYTSASRNASGGDVPFGTLGESVYIGYLEKFRELNVTLFLGASNGWAGQLEYATAVDAAGRPSGWKTLATTADSTLRLTRSGKIEFDPPADWAPARLGASDPLYYVRLRTTSGGNPPVATTILGRNYSNSNGLAVPSGTIPVFDRAADLDGDGYLNNTEYARRAPGRDARFAYESRVFYPYYGQQRFATNPSSPAVQQWMADYHARFLAANPLADGVFVDNSGGRNPLVNLPLVESAASYSDDYGAMLNAINRRIAPRWVAANTSAGGAQTDAVIRAVPMWIEEFALRPMAHTWQQFNDLAAMIARRQSLKSPAPYVVLDTLPTGGSPTDARTMMASLAYYYLLADPNNSFLMLNGGYDPNSTWTEHWTPAAAYDIGLPKGAFGLFATGADPANRALTYNVYQRAYDNALVLYKPLSYKLGSGTGTLAGTSATTHALNGTYRVLTALGTLSGPVTSVTLRNGEGVVLIKA